MGVVLCAVSIAASVPAAAEPRTAVGNPFTNASHSAIVLFVPLDAHALQLLDATIPTVRRWVPPEQELGVVANKASWTNKARGELNALLVGRDLITSFRTAQGGRVIVLIAVTSEAVYSPTLPFYGFVFGAWVQPHHRQYAAVIGTRPMRVFQPERERARLTKMMLRYIGEIVCSPYLRRNSNPRSVMYDPILGTADLDRMVPTLPARCRQN